MLLSGLFKSALFSGRSNQSLAQFLFGVAINLARFDIHKLGQMLDGARQQLSGVVVEYLPYAEVISRYDRFDT